MESNGAFKNITISDISIRQTRITGISIESVDGAQIDNINISNVTSAFFLNYMGFLYNVPPVFCNLCVNLQIKNKLLFLFGVITVVFRLQLFFECRLFGENGIKLIV